MPGIWEDYKLKLLCKSDAVSSTKELHTVLNELLFSGSEGLSGCVVYQVVDMQLGTGARADSEQPHWDNCEVVVTAASELCPFWEPAFNSKRWVGFPNQAIHLKVSPQGLYLKVSDKDKRITEESRMGIQFSLTCILIKSGSRIDEW